MHYRQKIRNRLVTILRDGIPDGDGGTFKLDVGGRVFSQRPEAIFNTEYPLCCVYITQDITREISCARDIYRRTLTVNIDLIHESRERLEDMLDMLSWEAEMLLLSDHTLGLDQIDNISLESVIPYQEDADGEQFRAVSRLTVSVNYWSYVRTPGGSTLREFLRFGKEITAQIGGGATAGIDQTVRAS